MFLNYLVRLLFEKLWGVRLNWNKRWIVRPGKYAYLHEKIEDACEKARHDLSAVGYNNTYRHNISAVCFEPGVIRNPYGWLIKSSVSDSMVAGECLEDKLILAIDSKGNFDEELLIHLWKHAFLHAWGYRSKFESEEHKWMNHCPKFDLEYQNSK